MAGWLRDGCSRANGGPRRASSASRGVTMEFFKVRAGSWDYPDDAYTKVAGVPLYAGFMYAAVGSYIVQAWRRLELRVTQYRPLPLTPLAVAAYLNFCTHHWIWDLRWLIAALFVIEMRRTMVHFTVGTHRYFMPLAASFVAIGFALWIAENAATLLGAWQYPNQAEIWEAVHVGKFGSWSLLVSLNFVLVATIKRYEGELYGVRGQRPSVQVDPTASRETPLAGSADPDPAQPTITVSTPCSRATTRSPSPRFTSRATASARNSVKWAHPSTWMGTKVASGHNAATRAALDTSSVSGAVPRLVTLAEPMHSSAIATSG